MGCVDGGCVGMRAGLCHDVDVGIPPPRPLPALPLHVATSPPRHHTTVRLHLKRDTSNTPPSPPCHTSPPPQSKTAAGELLLDPSPEEAAAEEAGLVLAVMPQLNEVRGGRSGAELPSPRPC